MRGPCRTRTAAAAVVAGGVLALGAGPAAAQDVIPDDFGAVAKVTKVRELDEKTVLFKQSVKSGGEKIGRAAIKLTFGDHLKISATWRLDEGTIKARGRVRRKGDTSSAPIVDGTAAYKGARGKVTFEEITPRRSRQEFNFR